ncbi:nucleoside monophosphate kinase [Patescibacteria group bacterium]|nr:nucleoside monophosphate kinase [Patescibacteria group bacterium]
MDLVFFGMQGSGKGTQGALIAKKFNLKVFETGGELRRLAKEDSPLGKKIKSIIEAGKLVDNEIVMEIIENFMEHLEPNQNVLFDGIPRSQVQAKSFNELLERKGRIFKGVLIKITEEVALSRLLTRRICESCKKVFPADFTANSCAACNGNLITRKDDNEEAIKTRLHAFTSETLPVIEEYQKNGKMIEVDGTKRIEEVDKELQIILSPLLES